MSHASDAIKMVCGDFSGLYGLIDCDKDVYGCLINIFGWDVILDDGEEFKIVT